MILNKENLTILKLNETHINSILDIEKSQNLIILTERMISNDMLNASDTTLYFGVILNNKLIGYIAITCVIDTIDILSIVTMKDYEHNGIASLLLEYIFNFAKNNGINKIFLEVRTSNLRAIKLYKKNDFKLINKRKNYYKDKNEDALIYLKEL